jgi:hypothetical protein
MSPVWYRRFTALASARAVNRVVTDVLIVSLKRPSLHIDTSGN